MVWQGIICESYTYGDSANIAKIFYNKTEISDNNKPKAQMQQQQQSNARQSLGAKVLLRNHRKSFRSPKIVCRLGILNNSISTFHGNVWIIFSLPNKLPKSIECYSNNNGGNSAIIENNVKSMENNNWNSRLNFEYMV